MGNFLSGCFLAAARELMQSRRRRGKNIKIAHKKLFSFEFFAPFNFLFFEEKQKCQTKNLKRVTNFLPPKSLSGLSAGLMLRLYNILYLFFKIQ
ncbi:hypothetical protein B9J78_03635 [bacterium Unc6]|nr:hypothetical protein [bacterium Unc6]